MCGGLASIFGRKPILLTAIAFFALGSTICGAAQNNEMLIAGRGKLHVLNLTCASLTLLFFVLAIQGFGAGGCLALTEIIFSDLVPLPERGKFLGLAAAYVLFLLFQQNLIRK